MRLLNYKCGPPRAIRVVLVACSLIASSCGSAPESPLELGVKRVALDLAFADADKAGPPPTPQVIITVVPFDEETIEAAFASAEPDVRDRQPPADAEEPDPPAPAPFPRPPARVPDCPAADGATSPTGPVTLRPGREPLEGYYVLKNTGSITIETGGVVPLKLPYPRESFWHVSNVKKVRAETLPGQGALPGAAESRLPPADKVTFDLTKFVGTFEIRDKLEYDITSLRLVERTVVTRDGEGTFKPSPAITMMEFMAEGDDWRSAGIDDETLTGMTVEGRTAKREFVDTCGSLHDTFRVESNETQVNLRTQETQGTEPGNPIIYNVATHLGPLTIKEKAKYNQTVTLASGAKLVLRWDYESTMTSVEPSPTPPPGLGPRRAR